jgi:hypothetical protein
MRNLLVMSALFLSLPAFAASSTGVGLTVGSPNGLTGRTWLTDENSLDYGLGWGLGGGSKFEVYGDYLWNRPGMFEIGGEKFDFFFGGGAVIRTHSGKADDEVVFGPRLPVGVSYEFADPDLELFTAFALNVGIVPHSDVFFDLHLGARFYLF